MISEPFVSIVTPFFNTREFLPECIESVFAQTHENWEYILIDNCSTDGSEELAARYAARYPDKIRVVKTGSFLSQVRNYNFALSCISARSKYCKLVQADDWIFPDCLARMVELAEAHPNVGIVAAYELAGDSVYLDGLPYPSDEVPGCDICRLYFLRGKYLFGTPTSLLLKAEAVRSRVPFYDERYAPFEDAHACFDLLQSWNFGFVHQVLTYSRRDNESILSKVLPIGGLLYSRFSAIVAHGRRSLSPAEYEVCYKFAEHEYFLYLGKSVWRRRDMQFWNFHRKALAAIGIELSSRILRRWAVSAALEYLGNPKRTLEAIWSRKFDSGASISGGSTSGHQHVTF